MTDNNDDKTLHVTGKKTLTLKPSGLTQGTVRQDMGRGRTKAVVVETRKRRPGSHDDKPQVVVPIQARPAATVAQQPPRQHVEQRRPEPQRPGGNVLNQLSAGEIDAVVQPGPLGELPDQCGHERDDQEGTTDRKTEAPPADEVVVGVRE